jgi:hypothetical protein
VALRLGGAIDPDPAPGPTPVEPTHAPTFTAVYDEVLTVQGCATKSCHTGTGLENLGDRATAHASLLAATAMGALCTGGQKLVMPGNPDQSLLLQKVRPSPPCGTPMPPPMGALTQQEIDQIAMWIQLGAKDD